jgi:rRNA-processing protein FCF1
MEVKDLSIDELKLIIQETVTETIESLLNDPDQNLDLKPEIEQQLQESLEKTKNGERGIPAEEIAQKLGLDW